MLGGQTSRNLGRSLQSRQRELQTLLTLGTANNIWLHGNQGTAWGHQSEEPQGSVWSWDLAARAGSTTAGARGCAGFRRNKMPPPGGGGLQPIEVYFLTVLEARRPKARCGQGHSPSQALGTALPCLFLPSFCWWVPWLAATSHQSASVVTHLPPCGSPCLHLVLPRHMSLSSFYKDTPYMGLRAHPPPG